LENILKKWLTNLTGLGYNKNTRRKSMKYKVKYQSFIFGANENDFFIETEANFTICNEPERKPDFVSNTGSSYFYSKDGVVRKSNHWLGVASCKWILDGSDENKLNYAVDKRTEFVCGFCKWSDFKRLGFIEEVKEMPKGTRKNSYKYFEGREYIVMEKAA